MYITLLMIKTPKSLHKLRNYFASWLIEIDIFFADCRASIDILPRQIDSMVDIIGKTVYVLA